MVEFYFWKKSDNYTTNFITLTIKVLERLNI